MKKPIVRRGGNRPIDYMRDGGGSAKLPDGMGNIVRMKGIGSRIYCLAEKGVTSAVMADQVDPGRTNPNIPFMVQRTELNYGLDTPFIQKTIGIAFELADESYLSDYVEKDELLNKSISAALALAAVYDAAIELKSQVSATRTAQVSAAYLPRTDNLPGKVKQSLAHLRDVENIIKSITLLFHPKLNPSDPWDKGLKSAMIEMHGLDAQVMDHYEKLNNILLAIADHRHAMIHADATKSITVSDYELQANGTILAPTILITHPRNPVPRQDVVQFLMRQIEQVSSAFEMYLAWMCDLNARPFNDMFETRVVALPDGDRRGGSRIVWQTTIKDGYEIIENKIQPKPRT